MAINAGGKAENILLVAGDVTKPADTKRMVEESVKKFGRLDVLVRPNVELISVNILL